MVHCAPGAREKQAPLDSSALPWLSVKQKTRHGGRDGRGLGTGWGRVGDGLGTGRGRVGDGVGIHRGMWMSSHFVPSRATFITLDLVSSDSVYGIGFLSKFIFLGSRESLGVRGFVIRLDFWWL
jgi:hypothetical protein